MTALTPDRSAQQFCPATASRPLPRCGNARSRCAQHLASSSTAYLQVNWQMRKDSSVDARAPPQFHFPIPLCVCLGCVLSVLWCALIPIPQAPTSTNPSSSMNLLQQRTFSSGCSARAANKRRGHNQLQRGAAAARSIVRCQAASPSTTTTTTANAATWLKPGSQLEQLAAMTVLSIDSGDIHTIEKFASTGLITDATTNPLFGRFL